LNPRRGWIALSFLSHKVLRWLCPFFLIGAIVASIVLVHDPLFRLALLTQIALYAMAGTVYLWPSLGSVSRLVRLPTMFAAMNLALLAGFFAWATGRQAGVWQRTARSGH
jgi:hypothetical protein